MCSDFENFAFQTVRFTRPATLTIVRNPDHVAAAWFRTTPTIIFLYRNGALFPKKLLHFTAFVNDQCSVEYIWCMIMYLVYLPHAISYLTDWGDHMAIFFVKLNIIKQPWIIWFTSLSFKWGSIIGRASDMGMWKICSNFQ